MASEIRKGGAKHVKIASTRLGVQRSAVRGRGPGCFSPKHRMGRPIGPSSGLRVRSAPDAFPRVLARSGLLSGASSLTAAVPRRILTGFLSSLSWTPDGSSESIERERSSTQMKPGRGVITLTGRSVVCPVPSRLQENQTARIRSPSHPSRSRDHSGEDTKSPPLRVPIALHVGTAIDSFRKETCPSANKDRQPPGCLLPAVHAPN